MRREQRQRDAAERQQRAPRDEAAPQRRGQQPRGRLQLDRVGSAQPEEPQREETAGPRHRLPRATASHRESQTPMAAAKSGPSVSAVRLNCTSVSGVFHAGREGTR